MKRKRIVAAILAATLILSGSMTAGAVEAEESQAVESDETEAEVISEEESEDIEDETPVSETAEIAEDDELAADEAVITDEVSDTEAEDSVAEETEEDAEPAEDDDAVFDTSDMDVGRFTGMKEIAEIDPELLAGYGEESNSEIQTFSKKSYSYSYNYTSLSFSSSGGHSGDEILNLAVDLIVGNEGGYNTVTADDNGTGAPSIGKIQWWAESALMLARLIVAADNDTAYKLLGDALYNEIIDSETTWAKGTRVFDSDEKKRMQNFLDPNQNPSSKTIQDKLAASYVASYLNHGYGLGIRNASALVYYADIENQYGYTGGKMGAAKATATYAYNIAGSWDKVTLNEIHLAGVANVAHNYVGRTSQKAYIERRRYTYGQLVKYGWTYCNSGDYTIPYDSNGTVGAAWLQVALNNYRNVGLSVTGNYDDALKSAVKSYQTSVGLTADGMAGLHTSTKLIHDMYYTSMQTYGASYAVGSSGPDIVKINGTWTYTVDGTADYSYTGLAKNSNGWYYIKNGVLDRSYTGFCSNENGSWYIENGKLTRKNNSVIKDTAGAIGTKGEWYYVVGSKVQTDFTGLANYKNASGWWYITNGIVDRTVNTVAKNKNGWYYVLNGKVQKSFTGLADYKNASGWWYITSGKVDRSVNTVAKNKNGWYYVLNGKVQKSFTGLADYKNASGWWYITNGRVDRSFTGIAKNKNGWYYVKNGKVQHGFNGTITADGVEYTVKNGKVDK